MSEENSPQEPPKSQPEASPAVSPPVVTLFGDALESARLATGLSKAATCRLLDISLASYANYLKGRTSPDDARKRAMLKRLANYQPPVEQPPSPNPKPDAQPVMSDTDDGFQVGEPELHQLQRTPAPQPNMPATPQPVAMRQPAPPGPLARTTAAMMKSFTAPPAPLPQPVKPKWAPRPPLPKTAPWGPPPPAPVPVDAPLVWRR